MIRERILTAACWCLITASLPAAENGYYTQPTLNAGVLIFVSEGDLWRTAVSDGEKTILASRLTSSAGREHHPVISPDGAWVAFSGEYDGNTDVFVMPVDGGVPLRLTYHPGKDTVQGWTPDGSSVLFTSGRSHHFGRQELWRISSRGGMPQRYGFGECSMVSMSGGGSRFAFTRWSTENWSWKGYRGGTSPDIWVGDLQAESFHRVTNHPAVDMFPLWMRGRVYFLSERSGTANLFSVSPEGGDVRQHTQYSFDPQNPTRPEGYDIRWPGRDTRRRGDRIVFAQGGGLAILNVKDDSVQHLDIRLMSDRVATRIRYQDLMDQATEIALAPDGNTLLIVARGELVSIDLEQDETRQLTHTSGIREWGAAFLDDDRIALISDATGEPQITIMPADGSEQPSLATEDLSGWLFPVQTSPDARWIAYADQAMRLQSLDLETLTHRVVAVGEAGEITDYQFSPDSKWLAYAQPIPNGFHSIFIHSLRTGRSFPVSDGMTDDFEPRWDPSGKFLYFLSRRRLDPLLGEFDFEHVNISTTGVYVVPLAAMTPPPVSPYKVVNASEPESDEQPEPADAEADINPDDDIQTMRVDTDDMPDRHFALPIPGGIYDGLTVIPDGLLYVSHPAKGVMEDDFGQSGFGAADGELHLFTLAEEKDEVIARPVGAFVISHDQSTLAWVDEKNPMVMNLKTREVNPVFSNEGDEGEDRDDGNSGGRLQVNIREEWNHIFREAWRLQRDFYWAPNMGGVNWDAIKLKYEALLPRIGTRDELSDLIKQMIGELGTSHTYVWGGEHHEEAKPVSVGLLGIEVEFDGRGWRINRILPGQSWNEEAYSPLAPPHLKVQEGDYLLAINGKALIPGKNILAGLQDQAGKKVHLKIGPNPAGAGAREIEVMTIGDERELRYQAWVDNNRRLVAQASDGKLGYMHLPDMDAAGLIAFTRQFYPQLHKEGIVIDIRDNGGGYVSQMLVQRLARKIWGYDHPRHGSDETYPLRAPRGHLCCIIDQHAGSDGDIFPRSFRALNLGPLIGRRTWGGVIGIRADKSFLDFGMSTQPEYAWWDDHGWSIENKGVSPESGMDVDITPSDRAAGRDPQLEMAIQYLLEKIKDEPVSPPKPPPFPTNRE